jgi:hypothetical protein
MLEISKNQHVPLFVNNADMKMPLAKMSPISESIKSFQHILIRFAFIKKILFGKKSALKKQDKNYFPAH